LIKASYEKKDVKDPNAMREATKFKSGDKPRKYVK